MKYGALVKDTVYIPGDERSRTHPGHGYPERTENYMTLHEFNTIDELKSFLLRNKNARAIQFEEFVVREEVSLRLDLQ